MVNERAFRILEAKTRTAEDEIRQLRRIFATLQGRVNAHRGGGTVDCIITLNFMVTDSVTGAPVSSATVDLYGSLGGGLLTSGVTDASGLLTLKAFAAETYTAIVNGTGYITATSSVVASCGNVISMPVSLITGIVVPWCPQRIPIILHASESIYGAAFTLQSGAYGLSSTFWGGCAIVSGTAGGCAAPAGGTPLRMILNGTNNPPQINVEYIGNSSTLCPVASTCSASFGSYNFSANSSTGTATWTCSPLNLSWSPTSGPAGGLTGQKIYPASTAYSITVTP